MEITDLKTENLATPLGIEEKSPRFSWKIKGKGCFQKNYRIRVATEKNLLDAPDIWDSGDVSSSETLYVKYKGKRLNSCRRYWWKVTVNGVDSAPAWFETAFLNPEKEFNAYWIGMPLGFSGSVDDVRTDIDLPEKCVWARFYLAALGAGRVYLNGKLLDDEYFGGSVAVYDKTIYYRTYELDLKKGRNALCVKLGYGFYGAKKMYGVLKYRLESGKTVTLPTIPGRIWNVKRDAIRLNGVYDGETYDARCEEDWLNPDFKVSFGNWVATFAADAPKGTFKANPLPPMRIVKKFAPKSVEQKDGGIMVDTGVNLCGFLTVKAEGEKGASFKIKHAERLLPDGTLDNFNLRAAECCDTYIFKGEGEESYTPEFTYHGFQYAFIETSGKVKITDVKVNFLRTDIDQTGKFTCSDKALNYLHKIAVQTEGNNLNGVYTDCPQRDERLGWLNDLTSRLYQSVCNYGNEKFLANFIDMITSSQKEDGTIQDTVPYEVGCTVADPVSAYITLGTLHSRFYGDDELLKRNYGGFCKWLDYLTANADSGDGTVGYGYYGDWCPAKIYCEPERDTFSATVPTTFVSGFYLLWYLKQMTDMAKRLGKKGDAAAFTKKFAYYREIFDGKYLDVKNDVYGTGGQTECAIAMTVFADETARCAKWAKRAAKDIEEKGFHTTCGNQGYRHLFYNLAKYGYTDILVKVLKNTEYPGWGYTVKCGATSVWERWEDAVGSDMHSFDHPMFSAYDGFFYNYLLGVRTEECENAFEKIVISPCFVKGLKSVSGSMETLRGEIAVGWEIKGKDAFVKVSTPANTRLKFAVKGKKIVYGDKEVNGSVSLTNGEYEFTVKDVLQ